LNFDDINISIDNVNLTAESGMLKDEVDIDRVIYKLENLEQSRKSKYIRTKTLKLLDILSKIEGRGFNRILDTMILDYLKNHHKNDFIKCVEVIHEISEKEANQEHENS